MRRCKVPVRFSYAPIWFLGLSERYSCPFSPLCSANPARHIDVSLAASKGVYATFDNATNYYHVFDVNDIELGAYNHTAFHAALTPDATSTCFPLAMADINASRGGQWLRFWMIHLRMFVLESLGKPTENPTTKDPTVFACVPSEPCPVITVSTPRCSSATQTTAGTTVGASVDLVQSYTSGYSTTATMSTTNTSTFGVSVTASVQLGIPDLASASLSTTISTEVSNSESSAFAVTANAEVTQSITTHAPANTRCYLRFTSTTCTAQGIAYVPFEMTGWLWLWKGGGPNTLRALNLAAVPGMSPWERQSTMKLTGNLATDSSSSYESICDPL
ncbi:hypothetical protein B0H13DRAFT_2312225 [Mycena leptocephala]|nr:hypothetical protein B0H13DRAFT_2312225 [Mycena leptocephala]